LRLFCTASALRPVRSYHLTPRHTDKPSSRCGSVREIVIRASTTTNLKSRTAHRNVSPTAPCGVFPDWQRIDRHPARSSAPRAFRLHDSSVLCLAALRVPGARQLRQGTGFAAFAAAGGLASLCATPLWRGDLLFRRRGREQRGRGDLLGDGEADGRRRAGGVLVRHA